MMTKLFTIFYNAVRFIGRRNYRRLLFVDSTVRIDKSRKARLSVGKKFRARRNVEINIRNHAEVAIGDSVFFNSGCMITARQKVVVGDNTIFGPNVMIFDNDHAVKDGVVCDNEFVSEEIIIGSNVWIGAGAIILKGSVIGDHCIIAAGSVVKGHVESGNILVQKRTSSIRSLLGES